jgi:exoribonuclease-2
MERFWTLQYLRQNELAELDATVIKSFPGEPALARADQLPLVFSVMGSPALERGSRVRVRLGDMDLIALDIHAQFIESLQQTQEPINTEEDEELAAGPLAIAVDLNDADLAPTAPTDASS